MENKDVREWLKGIAAWVWRLPFFVPLRNNIQNNHFTIIHYHEVDPQLFKRHLEHLTKNYTIIPLTQIKEAYLNQKPLPKKSLVITFDDGWKSNYDLLPIIKEAQIPVTVFISIGLIGSNRAPRPSVIYCDFRIDEFHLDLITDEGSVIDITLDQKDRLMLNLREIDEMSDVIDFQSHTVNHHMLPALPDEQLDYEIKESKNTLEQITQSEVYALAYPYNRMTKREANALQEAGFILARKGDRILNNMKTNQFNLNSIAVAKYSTVNDLKRILALAEIKTIMKKIL